MIGVITRKEIERLAGETLLEENKDKDVFTVDMASEGASNYKKPTFKIARDEVWVRAWTAVARCEGVNSTQATKCADQCLEDFDNRFVGASKS